MKCWISFEEMTMTVESKKTVWETKQNFWGVYSSFLFFIANNVLLKGYT